MTNINSETGIRYGVILASSLHPEVLDRITWQEGRDLTWEQARDDIRKELEHEANTIEDEVMAGMNEEGVTDQDWDATLETRLEAAFERLGYCGFEDFIDSQLDDRTEDIQIEEPVYAFDVDGVQGKVTWLGGAQIVFVFESPVTGFFRLCSPCLPNAGDLNSPDTEGYVAYTVLADWLYEEN